jgi:hypothetical protein
MQPKGLLSDRVNVPGNRQRKKSDARQGGDFAPIPNNLLTALQILRNISTGLPATALQEPGLRHSGLIPSLH